MKLTKMEWPMLENGIWDFKFSRQWLWKSSALWDGAPCSLVDGYWRFADIMVEGRGRNFALVLTHI